jgi:small subunit ribosomal protein S2
MKLNDAKDINEKAEGRKLYTPSFTIQDLIDIKAHLGHKTLHPQMRYNIYGKKNNIHIIDVRKTYISIKNALSILYKFGKMNKKILFVGTNHQFSQITKKCAEKCGQFYVNERWLGGTLTNWYTVSKSIKTLLSYNKLLEDKDENLTKKEVSMLTKKRDKLLSALGGIIEMKGRPDLVVVLDAIKDQLALQESKLLSIPTIAITDSNSPMDNVSYPIPANDNSIKAVEFYCNEFSNAILFGIRDGMKESGVDVNKILSNDNSSQ